MPVRKMTQQEVREWLGAGLVMPGRKPPGFSKKRSPPETPGCSISPKVEAVNAYEPAIPRVNGVGNHNSLSSNESDKNNTQTK
jgi:hypothetical protein